MVTGTGATVEQDPTGLWWITTGDTTTGPYLDEVQATRALHTHTDTPPTRRCRAHHNQRCPAAVRTTNHGRRPARDRRRGVMDPDEALRLAIAGLDSDDDYAAMTGLTDYSLWVSRGGFPATATWSTSSTPPPPAGPTGGTSPGTPPKARPAMTPAPLAPHPPVWARIEPKNSVLRTGRHHHPPGPVGQGPKREKVRRHPATAEPPAEQPPGLGGVGGEVCPVPLRHRNRWDTDRPGPPAPPHSRTTTARHPHPALVQAATVTGHAAGLVPTVAAVELHRWDRATITLGVPRPGGPAAHHPMGGRRPAGRSPAEATGRPVGGSTKSNTLLSPTPSTTPADTGGRVAPLGNPQATVAPTDTKGVSR